MDTVDKALLVLLGSKYEFLSVYANLSMLWWVSSIVFCASVIAAVWRFQSEIFNMPRLYINILFFVGSVFFITIVAYGSLAVFFVKWMEQEILYVAERLSIADVTFFEYTAFRILVLLGTTSFILVLILWIALWLHFARGKDFRRR